ncbi:MAG: ABC transporter permease [Phycisphaeraceae bacterium]|nr:ABC transporter permease [Phycisphaeraceae bacterium]
MGLKELWDFRELFYFFTWRDIKVKYKQTILGIAWAVLQPLLMMIVFSLFFGQGIGVPSDNTPYPVFVFSGLLLWTVFSSGMSNASNSMVSNASIIKKIYFPRLIIPISSILVALFDFCIAFVVYIGILIYYGQHVSWSILYTFPVSLLITVLTTFGAGSLLAALNVKYRDFRYVIPFLIQLLLFLTPVIYPLSILKYNWAQWIISLNPMTGAIMLLRSSINGTEVSLTLLGLSLGVSFFLFLLGLFYFRKTEYYFADLA